MKKLMLLILVFALPALLMLASCAEKEQEAETSSEAATDATMGADLAALEWMLGTWKSTGGEATSYEEWVKVSAGEFTGRGYRLSGNDTSFTELLTLASTDSGTYYIAEVAHNPEPTYFKMTQCSEAMAVFENPMHDFPQRLHYAMPSPDSLVATVEGESESGETEGFAVKFARVRE